MKSIIILVIVAMGLSIQAYAQDSTKLKKTSKALALLNKLKFDKAMDHYNHLAYSHALGLFEELAASSYNNHEVYPKLGDCYNNLSNTEKAEYWYAKSVELDSIHPEYYYRYGQVLRSNGKYADSERWIKKYSEFKNDDSRIKNLSENSIWVDKLSSQKSLYKVRESRELNSIYSDFGAVEYGNKIVFTSGRTENLMVGTYYAWNNKPFLDIYIYDTTTLLKDNISLYSKSINTKYHEGTLCYTNEEKTMYFTRDNYLGGKRKYNKKGTTCLMVLKAELNNGIWSNITSVPFNNHEYSVGHPTISPDGKRLYFASDMPGSKGGSDIYYVDIIGDNQYGEPVNLGTSINTEGNEMFPHITNDGLYFSSDGLAGLGGLDIYYSKMAGNGWTIPVNLGTPINSSKDDFSFVLNNDKRSGFIASNRPGGLGDDDIYAFTISQLRIKGVVRDTTSQNQPLQNAEVALLDAQGQILDKITTPFNGEYIFDVAFDNVYTVKAIKQGYNDASKGLSTKGAMGDITLNLNMGIEKPFILLGTIKDKKTGLLLEGVDITIIDTVVQKLILDIKTPADGTFKTKLEGAKMKTHLACRVMLRKEGFLAKTVVFDHYISAYETNLNEFLEISMDKIDLGVDIGKLLNINPIYFDLGKWAIRPDAAVELDKIVQAMKDNPTVVIELGSHTDSRGSDQSNMELSDKRAKASAEYIISKGIDNSRIYGKGYGESRLVNRCGNGVKCKEEEHSQNRRTEFKVVKF